MKKDPLLYAVIGALIGGIVVWFMATSAVNNNNTGMMGMMGMYSGRTAQGSREEGMKTMHDQMMGDDEMSMGGMVEELKGKTGDEFDKTFINLMIEHHQGAIDMARLAQQYAGHDEIKNLADAIIAAQTSEIEQMKQWFANWGY
jgi:uncharacterized protein (DUF305 family)